MTPARFAMFEFVREVAVPPEALWHAWTDPAARALWAAPSPEVTVDFLESDCRPGGREVSLCRVAGEPDIRCEVGWLAIDAPRRSVNSEVILREGAALSAALVTAEVAPGAAGSRLTVTVQLSSLAENMEAGYRQGFGAGLDNLAAVAARTMRIERVVAAPVAAVWGAWMNEATLPEWWGPEGFTCRTSRIDLRAGGEWVFDMIGPDGTVYPNHHRYTRVDPERRIDYTLHWGEDGPKHADSTATFEDLGGRTRITLSMIFATQAEHDGARDFGAAELGLQTLGKLARFIGAG